MSTLAIARALREAGIDPEHATAVAEAVGETIAETAATRADLAAVELRLSDKITAASWRVIGVVLGGVGGLLALFRVLA
ncbi:MAG: hypothetical protein J4F98_09070 [Acidobacteria bacterium]|nr:hypothetical protein [Acidobacteriota bacterium]